MVATAQVVVTCALIAILLWQCDFEQLSNSWRGVDFRWWPVCGILQIAYVTSGWFALSILLGLKGSWLNTWKQAIHYGAVQLVAVFTPGRVGEAVLPFTMQIASKSSMNIASAMIVQRIASVFLLMLIGGLVTVFNWPALGWTLILGSLLIAAATFGYQYPQVASSNGLESKGLLQGIRAHCATCATPKILKHLGVLLVRFSLSVLAWQTIAISFHLDLDLYQVTLVVALMNLGSLLPISFAGIGIVEGILMASLAQFGCTAETAVAMGMAARVITATSAAIWTIVDRCAQANETLPSRG